MTREHSPFVDLDELLRKNEPHRELGSRGESGSHHESELREESAARLVILVKHALPELDAALPPREWRLGAEGEAQARRLANRLRTELPLQAAPLQLVSSPEPKAERTAEIVAGELGLSLEVRAGLQEFDRPALPLVSKAEHAALNETIFAEPSRRLLGRESGAEALARFERALSAAVADAPATHSVIAVSHGTVIALLVAAHNPIDGFELWKRLTCPSFVVLTWPRLALLHMVDHLD